MPVFLPVFLVAAPVSFQIARQKEENDDDDRLQIPIVEPLLWLGQMTEHDGDDRQCLCPVYPVDSLFHVAKITFSVQTAKSFNFFLYFCTYNGEATDRIQRLSDFCWFNLHFSRFFRNFAINDGELFRFAQGNSYVSTKKRMNSFVLRSTFRNFGFAELVRHSEMKIKVPFLLHFTRFFVTL